MLKYLIPTILIVFSLQNTAYAGVDMFLKIDGVDGESQDASHKDEIDVLAWAWGSSTSGRSTCVQDVSLTKYADLASPQLLMGHVDGMIYPNAKLTVRKSGDNAFEFIVLDFKNLYVSSVSTGGSLGADRITETMILNFEEVAYTYTPQDPRTGAGGTPVSAVIRPNRCK